MDIAKSVLPWALWGTFGDNPPHDMIEQLNEEVYPYKIERHFPKYWWWVSSPDNSWHFTTFHDALIFVYHKLYPDAPLPTQVKEEDGDGTEG